MKVTCLQEAKKLLFTHSFIQQIFIEDLTGSSEQIPVQDVTCRDEQNLAPAPSPRKGGGDIKAEPEE